MQGTNSCHAEKRRSFSVVTGWNTETRDCESARKDPKDCGLRAVYFEPRRRGLAKLLFFVDFRSGGFES